MSEPLIGTDFGTANGRGVMCDKFQDSKLDVFMCITHTHTLCKQKMSNFPF